MRNNTVNINKKKIQNGNGERIQETFKQPGSLAKLRESNEQHVIPRILKRIRMQWRLQDLHLYNHRHETCN